jgi:hypothetical protein
LIDKYGPDGFTVPTKILVNNTEIDLEDHAFDGFPLNDGDHVDIIQRPLGLEAFYIATAVVTLLVAYDTNQQLKNLPSPTQPGDIPAGESPNNRLTAQSNTARPLQRIPDIFGKNRVYPDILSQAIVTFRTPFVQEVSEYFCIGRGEYLIEEEKVGETLLSQITGSTSTAFGPSTLPTGIKKAARSKAVSGQELTAINQTVFTGGASVTEFCAGINTISPWNNFIVDGTFIPGDQITLTGSISNNGTWIVISGGGGVCGGGGAAGSGLVVNGPLVTELGLKVIGITAVRPVTVLGPFRVPGDQVDEIIINIEAPQGLRFGTNGTMVVNFDVTIQEVDSSGTPIGAAVINSRSVSNLTQSSSGYTFVFPVTLGYYDVSVGRTSAKNTGNGDIDLIKWTALYGTSPIGVSDFGDVTTVLVETTAGPDVPTGSQRVYNAVVTRKLRSYDTGTQSFTAVAATAKMADAMVEILTDELMGDRPDTVIDLDQLYAIQDALDADATYGDKLGRFCYTFSSDRTPVNSELATCGNAARVFVYREGNVFRFARDEAQLVRAGLFNGRNKAPDSEVKTVLFQRPEAPDGVRLEWQDETTNQASVVIFPESPSPAPINPKKIDAAGIKNYEQAWNRAAIEWEKIRRERITVQTEVTKDGLMISPGQRVANVDLTDVTQFHGEVVDWNQDAPIGGGQKRIITSESVGVDAFTGSAILRDDEGNPVSYASASNDTLNENAFFIQGPLPTGIHARGDSTYQVGTTYALFKDGNDEASDYIAQRIEPTDDPGYVKLSLTNYDPDVYTPDTTEPT